MVDRVAAEDPMGTPQPWAAVNPYLRTGYGWAKDLMEDPNGFAGPYGGPRVAGFSGVTQDAMGGMLNRAQGGLSEAGMGSYIQQALGQGNFNLAGAGQTAGGLMGGLGQAQNQFGATAGGAFLGANPYLDAQFNRAAGAATREFQNTVMPGINTMFGAGGRSGSGLQQSMQQEAMANFGERLGGIGADLYGRAYETERDRMMGAAGQLQSGAIAGMGGMGDLFGRISADQGQGLDAARSLYDMEWGNLGKSLGVGSAVDAKSQDYINADQQLYNESRDYNYERLNRYMNTIQGMSQVPMGSYQPPQGVGSQLLGVLGGVASAGLGALIPKV